MNTAARGPLYKPGVPASRALVACRYLSVDLATVKSVLMSVDMFLRSTNLSKSLGFRYYLVCIFGEIFLGLEQCAVGHTEKDTGD